MDPSIELRLVLLLLYIFCLHAIGIYFFTRGFLLTRNELPLFSSCDDASSFDCPASQFTNATSNGHQSDGERSRNLVERKERCTEACNHATCEPICTGRSSYENSTETEFGGITETSINESFQPAANRIKDGDGCWTRPAIRKVIILILDALRFDFVAPSSLFTTEPKSWMNKLQVLQNLVVDDYSHSLLFKFVADPPTTSLQRLKGLTTGSLPTFIDVGNSFGAPAIMEDNIVHQLASNGKKIKMMGDDTWLQLFPNGFTSSYPFPSFNVKDLHTVDNGVINNLFPALYEDDWDVLIGHFLGVDHAGHIFGVESPHMAEKLEQYNQVIEEVITILRNHSDPGGLHDDTMLLVMGDHGQTLNGDHGGGTPEEVETALFAWTTGPQTISVSDAVQLSCIFKLGKRGELCIYEFPQLDFAATLSAVTGVPVPFGSIGQVNAALFSLVARTWSTTSEGFGEECREEWLMHKWMENYLHVLCLNSQQVNRFFEYYAKSTFSGFHSSDLSSLKSLFYHAHSSLGSSFLPSNCSSLPGSRMILSRGIAGYSQYLNAAADLARAKWTRFDAMMMMFGLGTFSLALVVQVASLYKLASCHCIGLQQVQIYKIVLPITEMLSDGLCWAAMGISGFMLIFLLREDVMNFGNLGELLTLGGFLYGSAKSCLLFGGLFSSNLHSFRSMRNYVNSKVLLAVFLCLTYSCSLLSNSFILREHRMVTFFLASLGLLDFRYALQHGSKILQALSFLILNFILGCAIDTNLLKEADAVSQSSTLEWASTFLLTADMTSVTWRSFLLFTTVIIPLFVLWLLFFKRLAKSSLLQRNICWSIVFGITFCYTILPFRCMFHMLSTLLREPRSCCYFAICGIFLLMFSYVVLLKSCHGHV